MISIFFLYAPFCSFTFGSYTKMWYSIWWCQRQKPFRAFGFLQTYKNRTTLFGSWMWISCFGMRDMNCNSTWYTCHSILISSAYFPMCTKLKMLNAEMLSESEREKAKKWARERERESKIKGWNQTYFIAT